MKPILFNTDMVRAILEGRKTVTRRAMKPQPEKSADSPYECIGGRFAFRIGEYACTDQYKPPYRPGNILYVRETFKIDYLSNIPGSGRIHYKSDDTYRDFTFEPEHYEMMRRANLKPGWRPSENMPREAARIFLRVTDVRVERLHEFGIEDAKKEGVVPISRPGGCRCQWAYDGCMEEPCPNRAAYEIERHVDPFVKLWDSTIKPADRALYGWEANPRVWVIEFKRISREEAE